MKHFYLAVFIFQVSGIDFRWFRDLSFSPFLVTMAACASRSPIKPGDDADVPKEEASLLKGDQVAESAEKVSCNISMVRQSEWYRLMIEDVIPEMLKSF